MCSGAIHASGSRPSASSSRSHSASWRSVFARRLRPRNARVSTVSARCATAPARLSAWATNSQPEHASIATCTSRPENPATHSTTAAGVEAIRPRETSPVSASKQSKVIWRRCTSNPATIAPGNRSGITCATRGQRSERPMTYRRSRSVPPLRLAGRAAAIRARLHKAVRRGGPTTFHQPNRDAQIKGRSSHLRRTCKQVSRPGPGGGCVYPNATALGTRAAGLSSLWG